MKILAGTNLGLRFLLELSAVAATAYWGYKTGSGVFRWALASGAPVLLIAIWALFVSPKATIDVPRVVRLAIEFAVLGAAAAALAATGHWTVALIFAVVAIVSGTLNAAWK